MLHVTLDVGVVIFTTNETFRVEDGVLRVCVESILRAVTDSAEKTMVRGIFHRRLDFTTHNRSSSEKLTHDGVIR